MNTLTYVFQWEKIDTSIPRDLTRERFSIRNGGLYVRHDYGPIGAVDVSRMLCSLCGLQVRHHVQTRCLTMPSKCVLKWETS